MNDFDALDAEVSDIIAHYGVKGMKWGVRNDKGHEGERVKTKKLAKLDKKWEKENSGIRGFIKVNNAVADRMNNGLTDKINNDPRWADVKDFNNEKDPRVQEYFKEFEKVSNRVWAEETVKLGSNPSGTKAYELQEDENGNPYAYLVPKKDGVRHAEGDTQSVFKIHRDAKGKVEMLELVEIELRHYGVKGMKWGVRKDKNTNTGPVPVTVTQTKPGKFAKSHGGQRQPMSEDAKNALVSRQKAKASTTDSLSNKELQQLVNRMNLERQYQDLAFHSDRRGNGLKFIQGLLGKPRYGGEKRRYVDAQEQYGVQTRESLQKLIEESMKN